MNIHEHMEAIFVVALATVGLGSFALDSVPEAGATSTVLLNSIDSPGGNAISCGMTVHRPASYVYGLDIVRALDRNGNGVRAM